MANMQIIPASKNVEAQLVEMMVPLYSYGCEKKVKKTLSNLKGIYSVNVDYSQQKVTVWGICNKYDVLATIKSKRKEARFWNREDNTITDDDDQMEEESNKTLFKARSLRLNWKSWSWTKVFTRSYSF
ncbi:hypothetical protein K2173_017112 [Erythroxylum novogranatense]|uniref:HMA domain-containing protein n=1 Tax=Erythroxylum novogranatense TaxID=1862640 RepID=A0AAV8U5U9_9ROSI|nr:hypothetical protein K2173_017112 [Erythroxylum novogranatense]